MKRYKRGIFIGKFHPLHMGHITTLLALADACDTAYLIFYGSRQSEEKVSKHFGYTYDLDLRIRDAKEALNAYKNISVIKIDIPDDIAFPDDLKKIKTIIENAIGGQPDLQIFGSEEKGTYVPYRYTDNYMLGPVYEVRDRENKPVSLHATLIREDYDHYKEYLPTVIRKTLDKIRSKKPVAQSKS